LLSFCSEAFTFTTLAGNAGYGSADGTGRNARFNFPQGVAVDSTNMIYVADTENCTIRKIAPDGTTTTLAGLAGSRGSSDGLGTTARFAHPQGVAVDQLGNVYVADTANSVIRQITPAGIVITLAGSPGMIGSSNSINGSARFNLPGALAMDAAGVLYVADTYNSTIRMVAPQGTNWVVTTLAGVPTVNGNADGTNGNAGFYEPEGIAVDASSNLYVADTGNSAIRKISRLGTNWVTTTIARIVGAPEGVVVDAESNVYVANFGNDTLWKVTPQGTNWSSTLMAGTPGMAGSTDGYTNRALFNSPRGLGVGTNGVLYIADSLNNTIRQVTPGSVVSTLAGAAGGPGASDGFQSFASFNAPLGLATDVGGNVYVADSQNNTIRLVTPGGAVSTLAGLASGLPGSLDGLGTNASFNLPTAVAVDGFTNLYVADCLNNEIRKLVLTNTSSATNWQVTTLAGRAGTLYSGTITNVVAGTTNLSFIVNAASLYTNYSGVVTNINGGVTNLTIIITNTPVFTNAGGTFYYLATNVFTLPSAPSSLDGVGANALFYHPTGLAFDTAGNLYVADGSTNGVRVISPSALVTTLPGSAGAYAVNPSVFGTNALYYQSTAVAIDPAGNIFVADARNGTIRELGVDGSVSTLAGSPGLSGTADGTNAAARFATPVALALDAQTNLFIADQASHTIRELTQIGTNWVVTTVGGLANVSGSVDGVGIAARFDRPGGLAFDPSGALYVADTGNNTVRRGQVLVEAVTLGVRLLGGQVLVSWPANAAGFSLETSTNLADNTGWSLVTNAPALSDGGKVLVLTNSPTAPSAVYRLRRP
jgi:sugar lactone lactonase YvrE